MEGKSLAQKVNEWRIFPRLFAGVYLYMALDVYKWVKSLGTGMTDNQSLFAGAIIAMFVPLLAAYMTTGSK